MNTWEKSIQEASGYLGLELLPEAAASLGQICSNDRLRFEVLAVQFQFAASKLNWSILDASNGRREPLDPATPEWWVVAARAARRARENRDGEVILRMALALHPHHAEILYHLACIVCASNQIEEAASLLFSAIRENPQLFQKSLKEPDLQAMWHQPFEL